MNWLAALGVFLGIVGTAALISWLLWLWDYTH